MWFAFPYGLWSLWDKYVYAVLNQSEILDEISKTRFAQYGIVFNVILMLYYGLRDIQ